MALQDGFGRMQDVSLTAAQLRSLLMADVKPMPTKDMPKKEKEMKLQTKNQKRIIFLLKKLVDQDIKKEIRNLAKSVDKMGKVTQEFYTNKKETRKGQVIQQASIARADIVGLGKVVADALKIHIPNVRPVVDRIPQLINEVRSLNDALVAGFGKLLRSIEELKKVADTSIASPQAYGGIDININPKVKKGFVLDAAVNVTKVNAKAVQLDATASITKVNTDMVEGALQKLSVGAKITVDEEQVSKVEQRLEKVGTSIAERLVEGIRGAQPPPIIKELVKALTSSGINIDIFKPFLEEFRKAKSKIEQIFEEVGLPLNLLKEAGSLKAALGSKIGGEGGDKLLTALRGLSEELRDLSKESFKERGGINAKTLLRLLAGEGSEYKGLKARQEQAERVLSGGIGAVTSKTLEKIVQVAAESLKINLEEVFKDLLTSYRASKPKKYAGGGIVPGPRVRKDIIPAKLESGSYVVKRDAVDAMLMPGEVVIPPKQVKRIGIKNLEWANQNLPKFARGGLIPDIDMSRFPPIKLYRGIENPYEEYTAEIEANHAILKEGYRRWATLNPGARPQDYPAYALLRRWDKMGGKQYFADTKQGAEGYAGPGGHVVVMEVPYEEGIKHLTSLLRGTYGYTGRELRDKVKAHYQLPSYDELFARGGPWQKGNLFKDVAAKSGKEINKILRKNPIFAQAFRGWWGRLGDQQRRQYQQISEQTFMAAEGGLVNKLSRFNEANLGKQLPSALEPEEPKKGLLGLPQKLMGWADKTSERIPGVKHGKHISSRFYDFLVERYGRKWAKVILASGQVAGWGATGAGAAAGIPIWLPGVGLWGGLPVMGGLEIHRLLRGKKGRLPPKENPTKLARGGIVTDPTQAIIGEAGPEAILPLDKLHNMILAALMEGEKTASGIWVPKGILAAKADCIEVCDKAVEEQLKLILAAISGAKEANPLTGNARNIVLAIIGEQEKRLAKVKAGGPSAKEAAAIVELGKQALSGAIDEVLSASILKAKNLTQGGKQDVEDILKAAGEERCEKTCDEKAHDLLGQVITEIKKQKAKVEIPAGAMSNLNTMNGLLGGISDLLSMILYKLDECCSKEILGEIKEEVADFEFELDPGVVVRDTQAILDEIKEEIAEVFELDPEIIIRDAQAAIISEVTPVIEEAIANLPDELADSVQEAIESGVADALDEALESVLVEDEARIAEAAFLPLADSIYEALVAGAENLEAAIRGEKFALEQRIRGMGIDDLQHVNVKFVQALGKLISAMQSIPTAMVEKTPQEGIYKGLLGIKDVHTSTVKQMAIVAEAINQFASAPSLAARLSSSLAEFRMELVRLSSVFPMVPKGHPAGPAIQRLGVSPNVVFSGAELKGLAELTKAGYVMADLGQVLGKLAISFPNLTDLIQDLVSNGLTLKMASIRELYTNLTDFQVLLRQLELFMAEEGREEILPGGMRQLLEAAGQGELEAHVTNDTLEDLLRLMKSSSQFPYLKDLTDAALEKGSIFTHDEGTQEALNKIIAELEGKKGKPGTDVYQDIESLIALAQKVLAGNFTDLAITLKTEAQYRTKALNEILAIVDKAKAAAITPQVAVPDIPAEDITRNMSVIYTADTSKWLDPLPVLPAEDITRNMTVVYTVGRDKWIDPLPELPPRSITRNMSVIYTGDTSKWLDPLPELPAEDITRNMSVIYVADTSNWLDCEPIKAKIEECLESINPVKYEIKVEIDEVDIDCNDVQKKIHQALQECLGSPGDFTFRSTKVRGGELRNFGQHTAEEYARRVSEILMEEVDVSEAVKLQPYASSGKYLSPQIVFEDFASGGPFNFNIRINPTVEDIDCDKLVSDIRAKIDECLGGEPFDIPIQFNLSEIMDNIEKIKAAVASPIPINFEQFGLTDILTILGQIRTAINTVPVNFNLPKTDDIMALIGQIKDASKYIPVTLKIDSTELDAVITKLKAPVAFNISSTELDAIITKIEGLIASPPIITVTFLADTTRVDDIIAGLPSPTAGVSTVAIDLSNFAEGDRLKVTLDAEPIGVAVANALAKSGVEGLVEQPDCIKICDFDKLLKAISRIGRDGKRSRRRGVASDVDDVLPPVDPNKTLGYTSKEWRDYFASIIGPIGEGLAESWNIFINKPLIDALRFVFIELPANTIVEWWRMAKTRAGDIFSNIIGTIGEGLAELWSKFINTPLIDGLRFAFIELPANTIAEWWRMAKTRIGNTFGMLIPDSVKEQWNLLTGAIVDGWVILREHISNVWRDKVMPAIDYLRGLFSPIVNAFSWVKDQVVDIFAPTIRGIGKAMQNLWKGPGGRKAKTAGKPGAGGGAGTGGAGTGGIDKPGDLCECICACIREQTEKLVAAIKAGGIGGGGGSFWDGIKDFFSSFSLFGGRNYYRYRGSMYAPNKIMQDLGTALFTSNRPVQDTLGRMDLGTSFARAASMVPGIGTPAGNVLGPLLSAMQTPLTQQVTYAQDLRQLAFMTQGINRGGIGDMKGIEEQENALKAYRVGVREVLLTNQSIDEVQKTQLKNWRRGIRDALTLQKITVQGLHTAQMIGANTEGTAELFADWHQNLQMSTHDLQQMGRSMQDIARTTGITGDNLIKVARSAETYMKTMQMSGRLTAGAGRNIMGLLAEATTTGTTEGMQKLLQTLSGNLLSPEGIDDKTRNLLVAAAGPGTMQKLLSGTLLQDRAGMQQMAMGLQGVLNRYTRGQNIERMDPTERQVMDAALRQAAGLGLKELQLLIQNFQRASRSFKERYDELNAAKPGMGRTKLQIEEEKRALVFGQSMDYLTQFSKSLEEAGLNTSLALENFSKSATVSAEDLAAIGIKTGVGDIATIEKLALTAIEDINKRFAATGVTEEQLKRAGLQRMDATEISRVLATKDPLQIQNMLGQLSAMGQLADTQQQAIQDPVKRIETKVKEIQGTLVDIHNAIIGKSAYAVDFLIKKLEKSEWYNKLIEGDFAGGFKSLREAINDFQKLGGWGKEFDSMLDKGLIDKGTHDFLMAGNTFIQGLFRLIEWITRIAEIAYKIGKWIYGTIVSTGDVISSVAKFLKINLSNVDAQATAVAIALGLMISPIRSAIVGLAQLAASLVSTSVRNLGAMGTARAGAGLAAAGVMGYHGYQRYQKYADYGAGTEQAIIGALTGGYDDLGTTMLYGAGTGAALGFAAAGPAGVGYGALVGALVAPTVKLIDSFTGLSAAVERQIALDDKVLSEKNAEYAAFLKRKKEYEYRAETSGTGFLSVMIKEQQTLIENQALEIAKVKELEKAGPLDIKKGDVEGGKYKNFSVEANTKILESMEKKLKEMKDVYDAVQRKQIGELIPNTNDVVKNLVAEYIQNAESDLSERIKKIYPEDMARDYPKYLSNILNYANLSPKEQYAKFQQVKADEENRLLPKGFTDLMIANKPVSIGRQIEIADALRERGIDVKDIYARRKSLDEELSIRSLTKQQLSRVMPGGRGDFVLRTLMRLTDTKSREELMGLSSTEIMKRLGPDYESKLPKYGDGDEEFLSRRGMLTTEQHTYLTNFIRELNKISKLESTITRSPNIFRNLTFPDQYKSIEDLTNALQGGNALKTISDSLLDSKKKADASIRDSFTGVGLPASIAKPAQELALRSLLEGDEAAGRELMGLRAGLSTQDRTALDRAIMMARTKMGETGYIGASQQLASLAPILTNEINKVPEFKGVTLGGIPVANLITRDILTNMTSGNKVDYPGIFNKYTQALKDSATKPITPSPEGVGAEFDKAIAEAHKRLTTRNAIVEPLKSAGTEILDMLPFGNILKSFLDQKETSMSPVLPRPASNPDPEDDVRKRKLVDATTNPPPQEIKSEELENIDANTEESNALLAKAVTALDAIKELLSSKRTARRGRDSGEDVFEEPFYNPPINTEWEMAQYTDTAGIDIDIDRT
jgi:hypothetical protein